jgi:hypothetical protein
MKFLNYVVLCLVFAGMGRAAVAVGQSPVVSGGVKAVQPAGDIRSAAQFAADCAAAIGLSNCAPPSTPKDCPAGRHWSTSGGLAHCEDTITTSTESGWAPCPAGQVGSGRDRERTVYKNEYTGAITYGSWHVVSSDCSAPPPPPAPVETPPEVTPPVVTPPVVTPPDPATPGEPPVVCCTPLPPVTCTASTTTETNACSAGYTGSIVITKIQSCPAGPYGAPSYSESTADSCKPAQPACPESYYTCGMEQKSVVVYTLFKVTYSGPSCTSKLTVEGTFYEEPPPQC